ncbi:hypothetical protein TSUD_20120 [Trifolium subterraneum]|uniref:Secreted protein n=1 Tax=Trifolium subterraneum TaxID=3900 RepID=A0A2Z6MPT6_TRISU|nr:hypothetical protein TSUD_20120 [Trifolium subterraneum]
MFKSLTSLLLQILLQTSPSMFSLPCLVKASGARSPVRKLRSDGHDGCKNCSKVRRESKPELGF